MSRSCHASSRSTQATSAFFDEPNSTQRTVPTCPTIGALKIAPGAVNAKAPIAPDIMHPIVATASPARRPTITRDLRQSRDARKMHHPAIAVSTSSITPAMKNARNTSRLRERACRQYMNSEMSPTLATKCATTSSASPQSTTLRCAAYSPLKFPDVHRSAPPHSGQRTSSASPRSRYPHAAHCTSSVVAFTVGTRTS